MNIVGTTNVVIVFCHFSFLISERSEEASMFHLGETSVLLDISLGSWYLSTDWEYQIQLELISNTVSFLKV